MSEKVIEMNAEERVNPLRVNDNKNGISYELDFNRESIRFAENRGFELSDVTKFPVTKIPEFFYYAFRKNHKNVARKQTDELLDEMGGLTPPVVERLIQLYNQAGLAHVLITEEDAAKNSNVTVEL